MEWRIIFHYTFISDRSVYKQKPHFVDNRAKPKLQFSNFLADFIAIKCEIIQI